MADKLRFTMTDQHLRLLRNACVSWDGGEYGAPAINCKRPYGNSDVEFDIAKLMGLPFDRESDEPFAPNVLKAIRTLHKETETALQVVLRTGSFVPGTYESDWIRGDWKLVAAS